MNERADNATRGILSVRRLRVHLPPLRSSPWPGKDLIRAVEFFDLDLAEGESLVVVGESGSGKSVLTRALAGLEQTRSGSVRLCGQEVLDGAGKDRSAWHAQVALIPQKPLLDVSPRIRTGTLIADTLKQLGSKRSSEERLALTETLLVQTGLATTDASRRVRDLTPVESYQAAVARALASQPRVLICDAPGETLEFAQRKAVLELLLAARRQAGLSLLLTALDARPWRGLVDRVVSMYMGRVVEQGDTASMLDAPAHPYTRALLASGIQISTKRGKRQASLRVPGDAANPAHPPLGCVFHPRCPMADAVCVREVPHLRRSGPSPLHYAACLFAPTTDAEDGLHKPVQH
ncbi:MAG: ATP-binding cassette domain-containing protein [Sinobacteraceae bacterium]|nr:ATP-binding cassette domain-containing protein [Nevskiaceae bacterium]